MIPPTPTPYSVQPPALAPIQIPVDDYRIWSFAGEAVAIWNRIGPDKTQVIQIAFILVIVIASMFLLMRFIRSISSQEEDK